MSKNGTSRSTSARKSLSHSRRDKKKIRRGGFKADQGYENAVLSIRIAGRAKGARSGATIIPRPKDPVGCSGRNARTGCFHRYLTVPNMHTRSQYAKRTQGGW